ncbi:unnamed protein product [Parnassius apollo]|uniref:(apollo) hypothetical protein n=1 Tax=Parnassius apollo TaxID=110799 RepID=A0A8S3WUR2_PARAO|nr:unnamed protein product [Parnassius apollo]
MEAKVKEEILDNDYSQPTSTERRKTTASGKERRSPEQEESRVSPTPGPPSPQNNGTAANLSSTESLSPPLPDGSKTAPALQRLRRFLSALQQFAPEGSADTGERVRQLIFNLVAGTMSIEEFQAGVQECTNYPLRASVPGFLRALLPLAQRDLHARARRAKQTPLQYIRSHEHLVLESSGEGNEIFAQHHPMDPMKRRASDPFYDASQSNGSHEDCPPQAKRTPSSLLLNPSPFLCPLPSNASLFDYGHPYPTYHSGQGEPGLERRDGGISVRDVSSMNASLSEPRGVGSLKSDDEWRNINTMLNCILSMVEKTKRALAILQQRGVETIESNEIKRAANEIMATAVRQTEERVAEVRRRAEDAVNQHLTLDQNLAICPNMELGGISTTLWVQVKRQALAELQRALGAAEGRLEPGARAERRHSPPRSPGAPQNCCWNCGRKAQETCSGCNAARYCGAFCQHKDWENHHQVCSGREQKPTALLRTSPPTTQTTTLTKTLPRATTPITATATGQSNPVTTGSDQSRLSLTSLNSAERLLSSQDRTLAVNSDRMTLASLSTTQGLIGGNRREEMTH